MKTIKRLKIKNPDIRTTESGIKTKFLISNYILHTGSYAKG